MDLEVVQKLFALFRVLGLTQSDVAKHLGVTRGLVSQWVRGRYPVPAHHQEALLRLVNEASDEDVRRSQETISNIPWHAGIDAQGYLIPSKPYLQWQAHQKAVDQAKTAYEISVHRALERFSPGAGLRDLHALADMILRRIMNQHTGEKAAKTWDAFDRRYLKRDCEHLIEVLKAIEMVDAVHREPEQPQPSSE